MTFDQMFHGWIYGKWLLFAELVVCGVVPAYLLFSKKCRSNPALFYLGGILACVGVTINRYVMTVQALAIPVMPFDTWEFYTPNWAEWGASFMSFPMRGSALPSLTAISPCSRRNVS